MEQRPDFVGPKKKVEGEVPERSEEEVLAKLLCDLADKKKQLALDEKENNKAISEAEVKLAALMQARGLDLFRIKGLGTFSTQIKNHPSVSQDNQEAFNQWLDSNGLGLLAKRAVHPSTLQGWVKEWLEEGHELPPYVGNFPTIKIHIHRS